MIQRLEAVRDEIFAVDDRQSVLGAARNKRRLGRAPVGGGDPARPSGLRHLQRLRHGHPLGACRPGALRAGRARRASGPTSSRPRSPCCGPGSPTDPASTTAPRQLHRLVGDALRLLGEPPDGRSADELAHSVAIGGDAAELVRSAAASLRQRTHADPLSTREAETDLAEALRDVTAAVSSISFDLPAGPVELPSIPPRPVALSQDPSEQAEQWLRWHDELHAWHSASEASVVELERRVADLGSGHDTQRIGRWAEVEAELDDALDRLAEAQERVRAHEMATAELAELRTRELELRDQERDLLARIAAADAAIIPPQPPPAPPPAGDPGTSRTGQQIGTGDPESVEWAVIGRLSRQRTVSFVGSLPLLVDGPAGRTRSGRCGPAAAGPDVGSGPGDRRRRRRRRPQRGSARLGDRARCIEL